MTAGACLTVSFAALILIAGSVQWFLLGNLGQWVMARFGRDLGAVFIGIAHSCGVGRFFYGLRPSVILSSLGAMAKPASIT